MFKFVSWVANIQNLPSCGSSASELHHGRQNSHPGPFHQHKEQIKIIRLKCLGKAEMEAHGKRHPSIVHVISLEMKLSFITTELPDAHPRAGTLSTGVCRAWQQKEDTAHSDFTGWHAAHFGFTGWHASHTGFTGWLTTHTGFTGWHAAHTGFTRTLLTEKSTLVSDHHHSLLLRLSKKLKSLQWSPSVRLERTQACQSNFHWPSRCSRLAISDGSDQTGFCSVAF